MAERRPLSDPGCSGVPEKRPKEEPVTEVNEEPKLEAKEEPKLEAKEEPKLEPKEEPKLEAKEEPKLEAKEEPKLEPKEEPKLEDEEDSKPWGPGYFEVRRMNGHSSAVLQVKFSPDGKWLASGSADSLIHIWGSEDGELKKTIRGHTQGVNDLAWDSGSRRLLSASDDKTCILWDIETGENLQTFRGHEDKVTCCDIYHKGHFFASGSDDMGVKVWDRQGCCHRTLRDGEVTCVKFVGDRLLIATNEGVLVYNDFLNSINPSLHLRCGGRPQIICNSLAIFLTLNQILFTYPNQMILTNPWDKTGRGKKTFSGFPLTIPGLLQADISISGPVHWVVAGSSNTFVYIWKRETMERVQKLRGHQHPISSVTCHPTKRIIASASFGETNNLILWKSDKEGSMPTFDN